MPRPDETASTPSVIEREVGWRDIPALAALEIELFGREAWTEATWWAELAARPRRDYRVLHPKTDVADVLAYGGLDLAGDVADVMTIAVAPSGRGRGLGTLLLDRLLDHAAARGASHVMLEVRADNDAARALYERAGFTTCSTRRRYYPDGVDALVMRLTLETR